MKKPLEEADISRISCLQSDPEYNVKKKDMATAPVPVLQFSRPRVPVV